MMTVRDRSPRHECACGYWPEVRDETVAWYRPLRRAVADQLPLELVAVRSATLVWPFLVRKSVTLRLRSHESRDEETLPEKRLPSRLIEILEDALNRCDWAGNGANGTKAITALATTKILPWSDMDRDMKSLTSVRGLPQWGFCCSAIRGAECPTS